MFGLPQKSIVISMDEAKEYVQLKIERLTEEIDNTIAHLNNLQDELGAEIEKLAALNNPPM